MILGGVVVPHPPLIIPEVGLGREKEIQDTKNLGGLNNDWDLTK